MINFPRIRDYTLSARIGTRPITALEIAEELKIDTDEITGTFQSYIENLIDAAVLFAEKYTKRTLTNSTFVAYLDCFHNGFSYEIRKSPFNSITSVYNTSGGAQTEVDRSTYYVATSPTFSVLGLESGQSWPTSDNRMHAVTITFSAGYSALPADLKKAVMQHVGALYANRGDCDTSGPRGVALTTCSLPTAVKNVFDMYKIRDIRVGI